MQDGFIGIASGGGFAPGIGTGTGICGYIGNKWDTGKCLHQDVTAGPSDTEKCRMGLFAVP